MMEPSTSQSTPRQHNLMFIPMEGTGHVLALLGMAHRFAKRHHSITFVIARPFAKYIDCSSFKIEFLDDPAFDQFDDPQQRWARTMQRNAIHFHKPSVDQAFLQGMFLDDFVNTVITTDVQMEQIIQKVKPDFIFVDSYVSVPAVVLSKIPWACVHSANPLILFQNFDGPPYYSGYSTDEHDPPKWQEFKKRLYIALSGPTLKYHSFALERGVKLPPGRVWIQSPYTNFYTYPTALDYVELMGYPLKRWTRLDHCIRPFSNDPDPIGCDLSLLKPNVPKIYFSLGSMGSADILLMDNLLKVFKEIPYQFIVSKGPNADKINLPSNCIGAQYLNQLKIIPLVDLVIFHGGNNTLIECLYFGKKMLILPLFGDQFDNGARLMDKKLGLSLRPYTASPDDLLQSIERLLNDDDLHNKLTAISNALKALNIDQSLIEQVDRLIINAKAEKVSMS